MAIPHRFGTENIKKQPVSADRDGATPEPKHDFQPDAIAVRAIARYNVERRKAGQTPLDLAGIEHFRRILTETIKRHGIPTNTKAADPH